MRKLKKRLLAVFTSIALVLGVISIPSVSVAEDEFIPTPADNPSLGIQIDGSAVSQNANNEYVSVFNVNGIAVTVVLDHEKINGQTITLSNTSNEAVLSALNNAILGVDSAFNESTMKFILESRGDGFTCDLERNPGNGSFSRAGGGEGGLVTTGEIHFNIVSKNGNNGGGGGGNRPNVQINMSSSADEEWHGQPAVREDYYQYIEGTDNIVWNYATQNSWKYVSLTVNNPRDSVRFDEGSPTKTIQFDPKAAPNQNKVDITFGFSWSFRPANNYITINGTNYDIPIDFNSKSEWLDAFAFEYRNQSIYFTIEDVELADSTVNSDKVLNINIDLRPVNMGECYIGNFLWRTTPSREGADDYIPHAQLTLISATYPRDIEDGRSFDEDTLLADSRLTKAQKAAKYITYGVDENGNGEMVLPAGTKVTMKVAPEFGYQVTAFKVNGQPIENANNASLSAGTDVAVFTFTIGYANFHLGADVLQVGNEAVTDGAHDISDAGVELSESESSMSMGTAKLEVEDAILADGQEELFENAADNGFELASIVDISLYNTVYKGTSSSSWDTPVKNLTDPATIYLALDGDFSGKNIEVIHEKEIGNYEIIEAEYIEEYNVIAFETKSFSNYAIAYGDEPIKKRIPTDINDGLAEGYENLFRLYNPNSGEHFYTNKIAEGNHLVDLGWTYEGVGWVAPKVSNTPVYRLYNNNSGEHHYTTSWGEAVFLFTKASGNTTDEDIKKSGWDYEGIGWYSDDNQTKAIYRLYNPNAKGKYEAGAHHYTQYPNERDHLVSIGWNDEQIGWYGL